MLMKKKLLFGVIAAVLVALNALAFSSFTASAAAPGGSGSGSSKCYQSMAYCGNSIRLSCTKQKLAYYCSRYYCTDCDIAVAPVEKPVEK